MEVLQKGVSSTVSAVTTAASATASLVTKPLTFASSFFANANAVPPTTAKALRAGASRIFSFLTVREALRLSSCSLFTSNALVVPQEDIQRYLDSTRFGSLGAVKIVIPAPLSAGNVRRFLHTLCKTTHLSASIDASTGHVVLDAGSAFASRDALIGAYIVPVVSAPPSSGPDSEGRRSGGSSTTAEDEDLDAPILKRLEVASYDEYDDFNPRHPNPRDMNKTHRRGDSMFNSDIEAIAQEALLGGALGGALLGGGAMGQNPHPFDLSAMAREAALLESMGQSPSKPPGRKSRVTQRLGITPGPGGDAASSDEEDDSKPAQRYL